MTTLDWGPTLVVGAHADDETLGAGGTIARLVAEATPVMVAVATDSTSAQYPNDTQRQVARWNHFAAAMEVLGVSDWARLDAPEMRLASLPGHELAAWIAQLVADFEARTVLSCFPGDANEDHRVLARAVGVAVRPRPGASVRQHMWFETPSATEWGGLQGHRPFAPNVAVDVEPYLESKLAALRCYVDEIRRPPHPRSERALATLAHTRGAQWGLPLAEVFESTMSLLRR